MLPENRRKTNVGVGIGTVLQVAGFFLAQTWGTAAILGLILILISIPVFIWGCMNYAEGKGHSKWVGLVGLAGLIGLVVLIILPDRDGLVHRLQMRKLAGLISLVLGLGLAVLGRLLGDLAYASIFTGDDVLLEETWSDVCMIVGICIALNGLLLLMGKGHRHVVDKQPAVLAKEEERRKSEN